MATQTRTQDSNLTTAPDPRQLGWPVHVVNGRFVLSTTSGFCGFEVPQALGEHMLKFLRGIDAEGPVFRSSSPYPTYTFIAEADRLVEAQPVARLGARLRQAPGTIVLPPAATPGGQRHWVLAPRSRWLPNLSTLLWALRTITSVPEGQAGNES